MYQCSNHIPGGLKSDLIGRAAVYSRSYNIYYIPQSVHSIFLFLPMGVKYEQKPVCTNYENTIKAWEDTVRAGQI